MLKAPRKRLSLLLSCLCFLALIAVSLMHIRAFGPKVQIFTLDDAYISAAVARHLALDHNWGVSPGIFSSASSSILWPLLLAAAFKIVGVHMWIAFGFNVLFGLLFLWLSWRILSQEVPQSSAWLAFFALLVVLVATPLPMMTFIGMEHLGFALVSLAWMYGSATLLAKTHAGEVPTRSEIVWMAVLAAAACSFRYEGMFEVAVVAGLWTVRRHLLTAVKFAFAGALPLVAFGIYSVRHGAHFVPNSLLLKAGTPGQHLHSIVVVASERGLLSQWSLHTGLFAVWLMAAILLIAAWRKARAGHASLSLAMRYALAIYLASVCLHCQFASLNWLWRYESYLMGIGTLFVLTAAFQWLHLPKVDLIPSRQTLWPAAACCVVLLFCGNRAWKSFTDIPYSAHAIFEQQYQTGMFLTRFYYGQPVSLNDIGVPSYKSNVRLLDLKGLGSIEVTNAMLARHFDTGTIDQLSADNHSRIAILYRAWFTGTNAPPSTWTEVGSWTVPDMGPSVPVIDHTFTFFATNPAEVSYLHDSLCANRALVPPDETQHTATPCQ